MINYIVHKWDNENQSVIEHLIGTAKLCLEFSGGGDSHRRCNNKKFWEYIISHLR